MTDITNEGIPTLNTGWTAENKYSITFSIKNRLISGLLGAVIPFEDVVHSDTNTESHYLGQIAQDMHALIAESINNPHCLAFWMPDNTVKIRRLSVDLGHGTYIDNSRNAIVGLGNIVTLIPKCVDASGNVYTDIQKIEIKNMEKKNFAVSIAGQDPVQYKATSSNAQPVTFTMHDQGRMTVRFKAIIPELDTLWLSVYPELYSYDADGLAKLTAWAQTQQS